MYTDKIKFKEPISASLRDLLQKVLCIDPKKRLTAQQALQHRWFEDVDAKVVIFDEQERDLIRKEFTCPYEKDIVIHNTDFTEHSINSDEPAMLKNSSTRSNMLCPFNTH